MFVAIPTMFVAGILGIVRVKLDSVVANKEETAMPGPITLKLEYVEDETKGKNILEAFTIPEEKVGVLKNPTSQKTVDTPSNAVCTEENNPVIKMLEKGARAAPARELTTVVPVEKSKILVAFAKIDAPVKKENKDIPAEIKFTLKEVTIP